MFRVYLSGPDIFLPNSKDIDNNKKATFIVFDENAIGKIDKNNLKTSPTPFHGRKTSGKVLGTFINGHATYIHKDLEEKIKKWS